jgi:hypothetical protein
LVKFGLEDAAALTEIEDPAQRPPAEPVKPERPLFSSLRHR